MTIDPDTLRKGDMLMSPDKQLYNVTEAMKMVMAFAFVDEATREAALAEGWNPVEDDGQRTSYFFMLTSLDGQDKTSLSAMSGHPIPDGWEIIAKAQRHPSEEPPTP